jgi:Xaa-Pro aminopeptidase
MGHAATYQRQGPLMKHLERIHGLRALLKEEGLDAYWIPSTDEHLSEYAPPWAERRRWLSGFTGSAGDLLVARDQAWLFTDGRYTLQATRELQSLPIQVLTIGEAGSRALTEVVCSLARQHTGFRLGFDPCIVAAASVEELASSLREAGGVLVDIEHNLVDALWSDRPQPPASRLHTVAQRWAGESASDKLHRLRRHLAAVGADAWVGVQLDEIAWLLNLRSIRDLPCSSVFESFAWVDADCAKLFLHRGAARLAGIELPSDLEIAAREEFQEQLQSTNGRSVMLDPKQVTAGVADRLRRAGARLLPMDSPLQMWKAQKNDAELGAMRQANLQASVAKTRTLLWLERQVTAGEFPTERSIAAQIESFYAMTADYCDLSFCTISAAGPNSALPHYGEAGDTPVQEGELLLLDSGMHAAGGTTDDTRTVAVGYASDRARRHYTTVFKAHFAAASQRFPRGTSGTALDALCRAPLWRQRQNYDHGTGHGVGAWLNVHEGPAVLAEIARRPSAAVPLDPGMVTSIEPGYYEEGWGGIRLENLYLVRHAGSEEWLEFECLTWIPFDRRLLDQAALTDAESTWLYEYHEACRTRLTPHLSSQEARELELLLR